LAQADCGEMLGQPPEGLDGETLASNLGYRWVRYSSITSFSIESDSVDPVYYPPSIIESV